MINFEAIFHVLPRYNSLTNFEDTNSVLILLINTGNRIELSLIWP